MQKNNDDNLSYISMSKRDFKGTGVISR